MASAGNLGGSRTQKNRTAARQWHVTCEAGRNRRVGWRMDNFLQQLINGLTLGSIYGLIAIGYTMVFGIIGMVNFAHGDVFMLSAFIALILFLALTQILGVTLLALAFVIVLFASMALTSLWSFMIERVAYRRLRGSFRLAPLI